MTAHNARYGWPHRRERARWKGAVESGGEISRRCRQPIAAWEPWDLDHDDSGQDRRYLGPSHRACNRATAKSATARSSDAEMALLDGWGPGWTPIPDDGNSVTRWSRHWAGGSNTRCRKML